MEKFLQTFKYYLLQFYTLGKALYEQISYRFICTLGWWETSKCIVGKNPKLLIEIYGSCQSYFKYLDSFMTGAGASG